MNMQHKPANTGVKIHELIQNRWSPRAFDPDKPVNHDDLLVLLEAARWAASCFNDQPWRFVVCEKQPMGQERPVVDIVSRYGRFQPQRQA
jgi:hypothetical protein